MRIVNAAVDWVSMGNSRSDPWAQMERQFSALLLLMYIVTAGIPGDGRCLFRSVVHGACIRSGKPIPTEDLQRKLADELRAMVADEFVKRREETEWMPITVYMHDEDEGGLIAIAEYGQQYGKEDPIQVLYHGYGHYDAVQIPAERDPK
ncbi:hypothetical protein PR202_ga21429 [Eleusine coracana subsp. coracana]|uniref:Ubiquitin thioesterase OTU n=1 Tax=Eleusine coracana subsp. coracana TaxID=191504 RepID=A0AAV5D101_ELECO|nr:hypothetical protein PR202_ga21429 [Eleusine coracana subsp. coracana]